MPRKKRLLLGVGLALLLAVPAATYGPRVWTACRAWLLGESFWRGRPSSVWREEVAVIYDRNRYYARPPFQARVVWVLGKLGIKIPSRTLGSQQLLDALRRLEDGLRSDSAAVPVLRDLVKDPDKSIRLFAIRTLAVHGPDARLAVPALTAACSAADASTRIQAALALWRITRHEEWSLPVLMEALRVPDRDVRQEAAVALRLADFQSQAAVPVMIETLREDRTVEQLYPPLASAGPGAAAAVSVLVSILQDYRAASASLGPLLPPPQRTSQNAYPLLSAVGAIHVLGSIGPQARAAVPVLTELLHDTSLRASVAEALWRIDPPAPQVTALLAEVVRRGPKVERGAALGVLMEMGPDATAALPAVEAARHDADGDIRSQAELTQWVIQRRTGVVIPLLEAAVQAGDTSTASRGLYTLCHMGPDARAAVSVLLEALRKKFGESQVVYALGEIGPDARPAVPALQAAMREAPLDLRETIARALNKIDPSVDPWEEFRIDPTGGPAPPGLLPDFPRWTWFLPIPLLAGAVWWRLRRKKGRVVQGVECPLAKTAPHRV